MAVLAAGRSDRFPLPGARAAGEAESFHSGWPRWDDAPVTTDIIDELSWRGLLAISTDLDDLRKALDTGPVTFYGGFDPTAPRPHLGNPVVLLPVGPPPQGGHR